MVVKKGTIKKKELNLNCNDALCPVHGSNKLNLRGRIFQGVVTKKAQRRVVIEFERVFYIQKYERYERRKTRLHARLPDCLKEEIQIGDLIKIAECRPVSKIIHAVVINKIKEGEKNESSSK